ncbi:MULTISPECIES: L-threonylcarbamoyladenylate synthase [unclassified Curtobacterium]|uniref:L-threonylcarbamoyladenylate synthase n=1 Tax=unclassified Curtobacterium TaxID=257496 RepID=UPI00382C0DA7
MASRYDCNDPDGLLTGMRLARAALGRGELVVVPTDTVYGLAADAFDQAAVQRLLDAKGRTRQSPPPVLIPGPPTLDALASEVPQQVRDLVAEFWPGGLTVILRSQPSLDWDLGETRGTVALRMPDSRIALELLQEVGPLAVSSANSTSDPAAMDIDAAEAMLGDSVAVYLDGGSLAAHDGFAASTGSTIVDATGLSTGDGLRIVRHGVIPDSEIERVVGADLVT